MTDKIIILLLEIGFGIKFNLVGTISLSELFLVGGSFWYTKRKLFTRLPLLRTITYLYVGLLVSQVISEFIVGNSINNALRGYAVTVVSYFHFLFLFRYFLKDRKLIIYAIAGTIALRIIFGSKHEGEISEVVAGEGATFLKFYLAPIIMSILLLLSIFLKKRTSSLLFTLFGFVVLILGARNTGLTILLTGLTTYVLLFFRKGINKAKLIVISALILVISYGAYAFYVTEVLDDNVTSGNAWQLKQTENPYNPINLLVMGRTETFVGWTAFMDKFWFGHGAWASDVTGKYRRLIFKYRNEENDTLPDLDIIPSHSVLVGIGVQNGIFSLIFIASILYFFLQKGIKSISIKDRYVFVVIGFLLLLLWNGLFSPISHFRLTFPLYFAFIMANYVVRRRKAKTTMHKKQHVLGFQPSVKPSI